MRRSRVVLANSNELAAQEVIRPVEQRVNPTPFELSDYPNRPGVRRFDKLVRFATIAPVKAGWLLKSPGTWSVTDEGRAALSQFGRVRQGGV